MLGGWEWIVIGAALFLLFGASRLPQLAKSLGQTRKAFKEGMRDAELEEEEELKAKQVKSTTDAPQISSMTDEEIIAEMRRKAEAAKG